MKKISLFYLLLSAILISTTVFAEDKTRFELIVGGGLTPTLGPDGFKDVYPLGFNSTAGIGLHIVPQFMIGGLANVSFFSLDKDQFSNFSQQVIVSGGDQLLIEFLGMGKLYLMPTSAPINVYAQGGAGLAVSIISDLTIVSESFISTFESDTETDLMLSGGLGIVLNLGESVNLFFEGNLNIIFAQGKNRTYLPLRGGLVIHP